MLYFVDIVSIFFHRVNSMFSIFEQSLAIVSSCSNKANFSISRNALHCEIYAGASLALVLSLPYFASPCTAVVIYAFSRESRRSPAIRAARSTNVVSRIPGHRDVGQQQPDAVDISRPEIGMSRESIYSLSRDM